MPVNRREFLIATAAGTTVLKTGARGLGAAARDPQDTSGGSHGRRVATDRLMVTIDTGHTAEPVSKYEFGMFIEHIGPLIYRSLWSEMLDDRKFYFPISSAKTETAAPPPAGPSRQLRKWVPVGQDNAVLMDKISHLSGTRARASSWIQPLRMA